MREHKSDLFEYSTCLFFKNLDSKRISKIKKIAGDFGLDLEFYSNSLEFDYIGRDTNRKILRFLIEIASVIVDCEGEVMCEIENNCGDNYFQFFSIQEGKLFCQEGKIVRESVEEVILSS